MRSYSDEGIVVKRSDYSETDKLITIFTANNGKVTYLAKGIRKVTSRRSGSLELFNYIKFSAIKSLNHVEIISEVQLLNSFNNWRNQLGRITLAYQIAETIDKLTPDNEPHDDIFRLLKQNLTDIGRLGHNWQTETEKWLINIVKVLGYWSEEDFNGDIYKYIEEISAKNLHSVKLLNRLRS